MREYRVGGSRSDYQEDHLISLELGGHPTDPRNLWPEPYPRASEVDSIENDLNAKVCAGQLSLDKAPPARRPLRVYESMRCVSPFTFKDVSPATFKGGGGFWSGPPLRKGVKRESLAQTGNHFPPEFCTKKALSDQGF